MLYNIRQAKQTAQSLMNLSNKSTFLMGWFYIGDFDTEAIVFHHRLYNTPRNQLSPQRKNYTHA